MLTRKNYIAIARIINDAQPLPGSTPTAMILTRNTLSNVASDIAKYLATDNKAFNRARFLAACGVSDG